MYKDEGKAGLLFIGSILFGIAAALLTWLYLGIQEKRMMAKYAGEEDEVAQVIVAGIDIPKGNKIDPGLFAVRPIPVKYLHPNAITPANFDGYVGRFVVESLQKGKPLLTNFLDETFPLDFSDLITKGRRAITVQVDEVTSIAGMIRPGNHADIYVNIAADVSGFKPEGAGLIPAGLAETAAQLGGVAGELAGIAGGGKAPEDVIIPVLQDVRVLATGREAYDDSLDQLGLPQQRTGLNFTSFTLDVTPEHAALLAIAEDKGDLIAVLRNRNDRGGAGFVGVTPFDLVAHAEEMKKQAERLKAAEAAGLTINENGEYVDANGNVIPADEIIINPDGSITTKDEMMKAAGYTINENGDYVDANGNVIKRDDVKVLANGTVMTSDGKVLAGPKVTVNKDGFLIDENGNVMTADGKILTGVHVNENGEVVGPDGTILRDPNLTIAADGTVRDSSGKIIEGVSGVSEIAEDEDTLRKLLEAGLPETYQLIIGGDSKDGVAKSTLVPIDPLAQQILAGGKESQTP